MPKIANKVQLITYVNRIGCHNFEQLSQLLNTSLKGVFGGVHLLPFFYPIDGADAGFDPIDHQQVDPRLGDWQDVKNLSSHTPIMADLIVNHISSQSKEFKDYLAKGAASAYANLILSYATIFPKGATEQELVKIYRPRPGFPFTKYKLANGQEKLIWTTFTPQQIDINVQTKAGEAYLEAILDLYEQSGISMIRLDAAGYAIKKAGTSCFMLPQTFDFINQLTQKAKERGIAVLVEIHSFYKTQIQIAQKVDYVYDFALPVLVLDLLFNQSTKHLKNWLAVAPKNAITVLDTHDGIGIVDVAGNKDEAGLIPDAILDKIVTQIHHNSQGKSLKATGAAASNLDLYQVNCTYFEALGKKEKDYLIARAIQFFVPGIPQVYYVGLFGDENDMQLLAKTNVGRDINRHYYDANEVTQKLQTPLVQKLVQLIKLRNSHQAFNGTFKILPTPDAQLHLQWSLDNSKIVLEINLTQKTLLIQSNEEVVVQW